MEENGISLEGPGAVIGRYRVVEIIGEGGFGTVYRAEQTLPVQRQVALKIIKLGMDTRQVVARFETERQALAMMNHPSIAKVYDAGVTSTGRPYFAMELVQGLPLNEFADREEFSTEERLSLFRQLCLAVQHAHQKGILHRDLKPSNVLVVQVDGAPLVKVIDFGIAKAMERPLTDSSLATGEFQMVGTPEYMPPEQASGRDVDTRADVYALGVLLYELLTGTLPFRLEGTGIQDVGNLLRHIREVSPAKPSSRVSGLGERLPAVASCRRTPPTGLVRRLRGDLDWIVMRALEKDRERRYATATELAEDIAHHLAHEPVHAGPPSALYRARKFVRRHTMSVTFAAVVGVLILTTAIAMTIQAGRIGTERDRANREAAVAAEEAETSRRVSEFLVGLFETSDPNRARGETITAREILDQGAKRIQDELNDQPGVQATMMRTIGRVYTELGLYAEARPLLRQAMELDESVDADDVVIAGTLVDMVQLSLWLGEYEEGEALSRRAIEILEQRFGPDHLEVAVGLNGLGNALQNQGRLDEARVAHERALAIREAADGTGEAVSTSLHNLAIVHYFQGDYDRAILYYERAAELDLKHHGPESPSYATTLHTLAIVYQDLGRLDEALQLEERSTTIREKALGPDHLHTAFSLCTLGNIHRLAGRPPRAEAVQRRALRIAEAAVGPEHGETIWMRGSLARTLSELEQYDEASELLRASIRMLEEQDDQQWLTTELDAIALNLHRQGRLPDAETSYRRALMIARDVGGDVAAKRAEALRDHATVLRKLGRIAEAEELELPLGPDDPED